MSDTLTSPWQEAWPARPGPPATGGISATLWWMIAPLPIAMWLLALLAVASIRLYKMWLSPWLPPLCRFEPTCSVYFQQALSSKGLLKGMALGCFRLLRCQPFCKGGYDPVE